MADDAIFTRRVNPCARPTDHRRLDELLDGWAVWICSGGLEEFAVGAAGFWASGSSDFDSMVHAADNKDAITTNAAIEDLTLIEQLSISNVHVGAVWRSNRGRPMEEIYLDARLHLSEGLRKRRVD